MPLLVRSADRSAADDYRKLIAALARRAARIGARDPEGAAQEAVKRSLAHPLSRTAVEFYFHDAPRRGGTPPGWTLLQLLSWLHAVLRFVVLEERARLGREIATGELPEVLDPANSPLDHAIDAERRGIVRDALATLSADHRSALLLRFQGVKYVEIARRLGVNENTVATWVRRGSRSLIDQIRRRTGDRPREHQFVHHNVASASNG